VHFSYQMPYEPSTHISLRCIKCPLNNGVSIIQKLVLITWDSIANWCSTVTIVTITPRMLYLMCSTSLATISLLKILTGICVGNMNLISNMLYRSSTEQRHVGFKQDNLSEWSKTVVSVHFTTL
jgi:hypothetical protein